MTSRVAYKSARWLFLASMLLLLTGVALHATAGATSGYPGPIARPGIPPGPPIGVVPVGSQSVTTYICGFQPGTDVTFKVDGVVAGPGFANADANGCVAFIVAVGVGPTVTIETFSSSGPISLGPVPANYGDNQVSAQGLGGPQNPGKIVGLTETLTIPGPVPPSTTTTTTSGSTTTTSTSGSTTTTTTRPGSTTTTKPGTPSTTSPTTQPGSTSTSTPSSSSTLAPFNPKSPISLSHKAEVIALAAAAAAAAAAAGAAAAGASGSGGGSGGGSGDDGEGAGAGAGDVDGIDGAAGDGLGGGLGAASGAGVNNQAGTRTLGEEDEAGARTQGDDDAGTRSNDDEEGRRRNSFTDDDPGGPR